MICPAAVGGGEPGLDQGIVEQAIELGWDRYMPILTDEQIREFQLAHTEEERAELDHWFAVEEVINPRPAAHLISTALFWKNVDVSSPELPTPTRDLLERAGELGLVRRHDPWRHYCLPLLQGAEKLSRTRPEVAIRVYLAADLAFLVPLLAAHCEVRLMRHSSLRYAPGGLWRLLALEDAPGLVTVMDSDMIDRSAENLLRRSDALSAAGLPTWRGVSGKEVDNKHFIYHPLGGGLYGTRLRLPIRSLLDAFIWHALRGTFPATVRSEEYGERPYFGTRWPGYGFDEWFLAVAVYPRLLRAGVVTYQGAITPPLMFPLDRAMVERANPRSIFVPAG
jgi:hypothetical protein